MTMRLEMLPAIRQEQAQKPRARCLVCGGRFTLNKDSTLRKHRAPVQRLNLQAGVMCSGSGRHVKTCEHCGHELTHEGLNCSPGCRANVGARYLGGGSQ